MNSGPILNRRSRKIPLPQWHTFSPPLTPHHGTAFFDLLGKVMPEWRRRKDRPERVMA